MTRPRWPDGRFMSQYDYTLMRSVAATFKAQAQNEKFYRNEYREQGIQGPEAEAEYLRRLKR